MLRQFLDPLRVPYEKEKSATWVANRPQSNPLRSPHEKEMGQNGVPRMIGKCDIATLFGPLSEPRTRRRRLRTGCEMGAHTDPKTTLSDPRTRRRAVRTATPKWSKSVFWRPFSVRFVLELRRPGPNFSDPKMIEKCVLASIFGPFRLELKRPGPNVICPCWNLVLFRENPPTLYNGTVVPPG